MRAALGIAICAACGGSADSRLVWQTDEAAAFAKARVEHKGVLVDLVATWSVPSVELDGMLHDLGDVITPSFVPFRVDVSDRNDKATELEARYGAALPTILLLDIDGTVVGSVHSAHSPDELRQAIVDAAHKLKPQ
jgi:thiol:disulfide interchange protein